MHTVNDLTEQIDENRLLLPMIQFLSLPYDPILTVQTHPSSISSILIRHLIPHHFRSHIDDFLGRPLLSNTRRADICGSGQSLDRTELAAGRDRWHRDADVLGRTGDHLGIEAGNVNAFGLVLVRGRNNLNDLVARELKLGDVHGAAVH